MKNIVATLIILHNIESLFHACGLPPREDENATSLRAERGNPHRRPVCLCEWKRSNLRLINIGVYNYVDVYQFA